jgi:hypothetical protein
MSDKKIKTRIAFIYSPCETLTKDYFFTISYHFFMTALKRHPEIEISYISVIDIFDVLDLKGKFDVILLFENRIHCVPKKLINIKKSGIPVIVRVGDLHISKIYDTGNFHDEFNVSAYFGYQHSKNFYNYFPKNYDYQVVLYGLEPSLYKNLKPFSERIPNKILNSGAIGNTKFFSKIINQIRNPENALHHYKLRTKCNKLNYVDYTPTLQHEYVGDKYPLLLEKYMASIAATTINYTTKYFEIPAAGCLSFMEVNNLNGAEKLGFKDFENSVFINEQNYEKKFNEFLETVNDPKWEKIAKSGHEHVMKNLTNDNAVDSLLL